MKITFLLLAAGVIISACNSNHLKQPEYRDVRNIRLIQLGPLQSTAGADLVFYNPNGFGVQIAAATGDIYIDSSYFGKFELNEKVQVKRKSEFTLPAIIKIDMLEMIKNQHRILKKKEALIQIQGTATLKKSAFTKEVPINYARMQDIEELKKIISN